MNANLRTSLAAAVLFAAVPTASIASAHGDRGHGAKGGHGKPGKRCDRGGRGYEAAGRLADGSTLEQTAGADTARRSDDRYSGTLVVNVRRGNKRGRADKGVTTFVVTGVRAMGTVSGDDPLPAVGTRVQLRGTTTAASCPTPTTPAATTPTTPDPVATQASAGEPSSGGADDPGATTPGADYPAATGDATAPTTPAASGVTIRLVVFQGDRQGHGRGGDDQTTPAGDDSTADDQGDDHGGDRPGRGRPQGARGPQGGDDDPAAGDDQPGDDDPAGDDSAGDEG